MARPPRLSRAEFEKLVEKAIAELPEEFRSRIENVVIAVEDEPTDEDYALTDTPDDEDLFGIYRGSMRTEMSWDVLPELPPQVVVFRGPILRNPAPLLILSPDGPSGQVRRSPRTGPSALPA